MLKTDSQQQNYAKLHNVKNHHMEDKFGHVTWKFQNYVNMPNWNIFLSDFWSFQIKFGMADQDDYESLPESAPFKAVATAGACAGIAEHCAMYPIDSVKVSWRKEPIFCSMLS